MRPSRLSVFLCVAVLMPTLGNAQVFRRPTPPPLVTAANSAWQLAGEPLFHAGSFYDPGGPDVFFDENVMVRVGVYEGVPLYEDATLEPYSVVFVPVAEMIMRPYERRTQVDGVTTAVPWMPLPIAPRTLPSPRVAQEPVPVRLVGTASLQLVQPVSIQLVEPAAQPAVPPAPQPAPPVPGGAQSIPPPASNDGVWIEFQGDRWFSAGAAVSMEPGRMTLIGEYRGFAVFRSPDAPIDTIYVTVVADGPLAPYSRR